jgi:hypothetical protein
MRLERSFSIERFLSYTTSKIRKVLVQRRGIFHIFSMFYRVSRLVAVNAKEGSAHYEAPREEASSSSQMDGWLLSVLEILKKNLD